MKNKIKKIEIDFFLTLTVILFVLIIFSAIQISAQEKEEISKINNPSNIDDQNSPQAIGDKIQVKNGSGDPIFTINDEGSDQGSVTFTKMLSAPTVFDNKLYNVNGTLHFNGFSIGGASQLNDLTDARTIGNSVFLGMGAGANDDGSDNKNYALGLNSLFSTTSGYSNLGLGFNSLYFNTVGNQNIGLGQGSLYYNSTGSGNVAVGYHSNHHNQTGSNNTILGHNAGRGTSTHNKSGNVFIGYEAGYNETGSNKLYIENSFSASPLVYGDFNDDSISINGNLNVTGNITTGGIFPGVKELDDIVDAKTLGLTRSIYFGQYAGLNSNSASSDNIGIGRTALQSNTSGHDNIAIGQNLENNTVGSYNVTIGNNALNSNINGSRNICIGELANASNQSGNNNVIIGYNSAKESGDINGNVFLGFHAGFYETTNNKLYIENSFSSSPLVWGDFENDILKLNGDFHVTDGELANDVFTVLKNGKVGIGSSNPSYNLAIHGGIGSNSSQVLFQNDDTGINGLRIGINSIEESFVVNDQNKDMFFSTNSTERMRIKNDGKVGIGRIPSNYTFEVEGTAGKSIGGTTWSVISDIRLKDIRGNYEKGLDEIEKLRTIRFNYKTNNELGLPSNTEEYGFIAQEVQKLFPEAVNKQESGYLDFNMHPINVAMVNAVQDLSKNKKQLEERIKILEKQNSELERRLTKLEDIIIANSFATIIK